MKALRNFTHNGVQYTAGQLLNIQIITDEQLAEIKQQLLSGHQHTDFPLAAHETSVFANKMTQGEHDTLVDLEVISDDDNAPLPTVLPTKLLNYEVQEGDNVAEAQRKRDQAANRADNVGAPQAPTPMPSQVAQGNPQDAQAAIDKANAAAAQAPAAPKEG